MHSVIKQILVFVIIISISGCSVYDYFFSTTPEDSISHGNFNWVKDSTKHVTYYYEDKSSAQKKIDYIKSQTEEALAYVLSLIGESEYPHRITYFIVESTEQMNELENEWKTVLNEIETEEIDYKL